MIYTILAAVALFALSAWCKAAMDTRVFQDRIEAFQSGPVWFKHWMQTRGKIPVIKIDDGWHMMQLVCFLSLGIGYLLCGMLYSEIGYWVFLSIPLRTIVHGIVFETAYPMN